MFKTAAFVLSVMVMTAPVLVIGQTRNTVTLNVRNKPLRDVIDLIYSQTGISVLYSAEKLRDAKPITVDIENVSIREALEEISKDQYFTVIDKEGSLNLDLKKIYFEGRVMTGDYEPVVRAKVTVTGTSEKTLTDQAGKFVLENVYANAEIVITSDYNYPDTSRLEGKTSRLILLKPKYRELDQVNITGNTGHQPVKYKSTPASVQIISEELLDQWVSSSILKPMQGTVSGFQDVNNKVYGINQGRDFTNGARNTMNSDPNPLIIVDNFPFAGKISDLNPDDIVTITILKDAAAAARWGAKAGNGVVVITTRQAKYNRPFGLSFNTWTSFQAKPDLHRENLLDAAGTVEIQDSLFKKHFYRPLELTPVHPALPPVAEVLIKERDGLITSTEAKAALAEIAGRDTRTEMEKYFMKNSHAANFSLQLSGGSNQFAWLASGSYFNSSPEVRGSQYQRVTGNLINKFRPWKKIELTGRIVHSLSRYQNMDGLPAIPSQEVKLADENGVSQPYPFGVRAAYADTAANGSLLDWKYYPLDEFRQRDRNMVNRNTRISGELRATILPGIDLNILYQHQSLSEEFSNLQNRKTYYTRDLVNSYSEMEGSALKRHIPYGDILDLVNNTTAIRNFRAMISYTKNWSPATGISAYVGREVITSKTRLSTSKTYDYSVDQPEGATDLNYSISYPQFDNPNVSDMIPRAPRGYSLSQSLHSYYASANFKLKNNYSFSASGRVDKSNLYRATAGSRSLPLYSLGIAWNLSNEPFYRAAWLPELRLRTTYGISGNTPAGLASVTTIVYSGLNPNGDPTGAINNPADSNLRWEKVRTFNIGFNFSTKNNVLQGTVDWYHRKSDDLVGYIPVNNTTTPGPLLGNVGEMASHNIDVLLNAKIINRAFRWNAGLVFSYLNEYVTHSRDTLAEAWQYCDPEYLTVVEGHPLYGVYSFKYRGLDDHGNPLGVQSGHTSQDYDSIVTKRGYSELNYHGRYVPAIFGNFTNYFSWKKFTLSINLRYKFNYYFKRGGVYYYGIFNLGEPASGDVARRWRKPGDEKITDVPGLPENPFIPHNYRDLLYDLSEARVERGDHIRLENIYLEYNLGKSVLEKLNFLSGKIYVNANNIGIIWRANDKRIDPDQVKGYIQPCTFSIGFKGNL